MSGSFLIYPDLSCSKWSKIVGIDMQKAILEKISIIENLQLDNLYTKKEILIKSLRSSIIKSLITTSKKVA